MLFFLLTLSIVMSVILASRASLLFSFLAALPHYRKYLPFVVLVLPMLFISNTDFANLALYNRYVELLDGGEDLRVFIAKKAIEYGINWPLSGGAGQFEYYMKSKVIGRDAVTHNSFLYVWTNIGVLALLFVVPFYLAIKKLKMSAKTKYLVIILLGYNLFYDMIASAMLMMAHGFVFGMINCERKEELIL